ncbi:MAG: DMT family transporter [Actinomycetota bacterium]|nr:DMT family transporter [Actinomycetota bacterium]MDQ3956546.1 DMT family transporter [Actinomycetota bacterium]
MFFAFDLVFWHNAIDAVGAGLATVLGNLQVLIVGFSAWALLGERPRRQLFWAIPVVLTGVVLISGAIGSDAYGEDPALGVLFGALTSLAYAAFILVLREGSRDLRRVAGPLFHATLVAALTTAFYGAVAGDVEWAPRWPEHALALSAQVAGWLLISRSLPRLPAAVTSIVLLLQPVGAMTIAALALGESPGAAQLLGAALILGGVVVATSGRGGRAGTGRGGGIPLQGRELQQPRQAWGCSSPPSEDRDSPGRSGRASRIASTTCGVPVVHVWFSIEHGFA